MFYVMTSTGITCFCKLPAIMRRTSRSGPSVSEIALCSHLEGQRHSWPTWPRWPKRIQTTWTSTERLRWFYYIGAIALVLLGLLAWGVEAREKPEDGLTVSAESTLETTMRT
jgi:hypothetical protein